jgi:hypothetical protein
MIWSTKWNILPATFFATSVAIVLRPYHAIGDQNSNIAILYPPLSRHWTLCRLDLQQNGDVTKSLEVNYTSMMMSIPGQKFSVLLATAVNLLFGKW